MIGVYLAGQNVLLVPKKRKWYNLSASVVKDAFSITDISVTLNI